MAEEEDCNQLPPDIQQLIFDMANLNTKSKSLVACVNRDLKEQMQNIPLTEKGMVEYERISCVLNDAREVHGAENITLLPIGTNYYEKEYIDDSWYNIKWTLYMEMPDEIKSFFPECLIKMYPLNGIARFVERDDRLYLIDCSISIDSEKIKTIPIMLGTRQGRTRCRRGENNGCQNVSSLLRIGPNQNSVFEYREGRTIPYEWVLAMIMKARKIFETDGHIIPTDDDGNNLGLDKYIQYVLQSGGKSKKIYKGRKYVVRTGSKGGKYILVKQKKIYIT